MVDQLLAHSSSSFLEASWYAGVAGTHLTVYDTLRLLGTALNMDMLLLLFSFVHIEELEVDCVLSEDAKITTCTHMLPRLCSSASRERARLQQ